MILLLLFMGSLVHELIAYHSFSFKSSVNSVAHVPQYTLLSLGPDSTANYENVIEKKSFKRFWQIETRYRDPELENLYPILCSLELACRDINRLMRRVVTDKLDGYNSKGSEATTNIQVNMSSLKHSVI